MTQQERREWKMPTLLDKIVNAKGVTHDTDHFIESSLLLWDIYLSVPL